MREKGFSPIFIILGIILFLGITGGAYYLGTIKNGNVSRTSIPTTNQDISQPNSASISTNQKPVNNIGNSLPKIAYLYRFGIADPQNTDPNNGKIFILNLDGSDKKVLSVIDKNKLQQTSGSLVFSPASNELLLNTDNALLGINIENGNQRQIYSKKIYNYELSGDNKSVCVSDNNTDQTKQTKIEIKSLSATPVTTGSCHQLKPPYYDPVTKQSVDIQPKETKTGGAGTFILSSTVTVNTSDGNKKVFTFNKEGSLEPIFMANNLLYFVVQQCCAGTNSLKSLQQMDLNSGNASDPTTLTSIYEKIKILSNTPVNLDRSSGEVGSIGVSPDGSHYLYLVVSPKDKDYVTRIYSYSVLDGKETTINELPSFADLVHLAWSSDGRFLLIGASNTTGGSSDFILYDLSKGEKITNAKLSNEFYTMLQ